MALSVARRFYPAVFGSPKAGFRAWAVIVGLVGLASVDVMVFGRVLADAAI